MIKGKLPFYLWLVTGFFLYVPFSYISFTRDSFFLENLESFGSDQIGTVIICLFLIWFHYLVLFFFQKKIDFIPTKRLVLFALPILILLTLTPPFFGMDNIAYQLSADNFVSYGANPYIVPIGGVSENPWTAELGDIYWKNNVTPYGPAFNLITIPFGLLPNFNLVTNIRIFSVFITVIFVCLIFLFENIRKRFGLPKLATVLFAFNPAILINGILESHNDIIVLAFLMLTIHFLFVRNNFWSIFFGALAVSIKYFPVVFFPIYFFRDKSIKWKDLIYSSSLGILVFLANSAFFGFPFKAIYQRIIAQEEFACLFQCTPTAYLSYVGGDAIKLLILLFFAAAYIFLVRKFLFDKWLPVEFIFWTLMIFFFIYPLPLAPWYLILPIAFGLLIIKLDRYTYLTILLTGYSLFSYFGSYLPLFQI